MSSEELSQPKPWIPAELRGASFNVRSATDVGIGRHRQDSGAFRRPYRGIRSVVDAEDVVQRAKQYLPRLKSNQVFAGFTAMRLHAIPLPTVWHRHETVELAVGNDDYVPRSRGVRGHRLAMKKLRRTIRHGVPVLDPVASVLDSADRLETEWLVTAFEALLATSDRYPGLYERPMCADVEGIRERVEEWGPGPQRMRARTALKLVRSGSESPQETRTRLLFVRAGLPEPMLQHPIGVGWGQAHIDGAWPDYRVGYEYEGDHHRHDRTQWSADIHRFEELGNAGWDVLRITAGDLMPDNRAGVLQRAERALRRRGWLGRAHIS